MSSIQKLNRRAVAAWIAIPERLADRSAERERGDVPGWVLITLMTAGLVTALWKFAAPALTGLFGTAIHSVSGG